MIPVHNDTIIALATASGSSAIAVIRLSGQKAFSLSGRFFFKPSGKAIDLSVTKPNLATFGILRDGNEEIDEVILTFFKAPKSYTGEDSVEISCHGSVYIQQRILNLFLKAGARLAEPGEFTMRAFLNGKMDLTQAEAVADLISSQSRLAHQVALSQLRGGFSSTIKQLREQLINFASMIELELDFSEEDVEFANRNELLKLVENIGAVIGKLLQGFELGNAIRNGIPAVIAGKPNAGKSTLLNALLEDERAIVSDIPGTTRDTIEDHLNLNGVLFRFIDTAGLRETNDSIEKIGVTKALDAIKRSAITLYLFDANVLGPEEVKEELSALPPELDRNKLILIANKTDIGDIQLLTKKFKPFKDLIYISAKSQHNLNALKQLLLERVNIGELQSSDTIITNARHAAALEEAFNALEKVKSGLQNGLAGDFLALDLRHALEQLGNLTGEVNSEDLLTNIFSKFCIGK